MAVAARIESPAKSDRRSESRRKIHLESALAGSGSEVLIHDISATGALLETEARLEPFEMLHFHLPEAGETEAVVVWSSGHFFGCEFTKPISKGAISAAMLRSPMPAAAGPAAGTDELLELGVEDEAGAGELSFGTKLRAILAINFALWALILWAIGIF